MAREDNSITRKIGPSGEYIYIDKRTGKEVPSNNVPSNTTPGNNVSDSFIPVPRINLPTQPISINQPVPGSKLDGTGQRRTIEDYLSQFRDQPYSNTTGFNDLIGNYWRQLAAPKDARGWTPEEVKGQISNYANTFSSQFRDFVGRDPNAEEYNTFFQTLLTPDKPWMRLNTDPMIDPNIFGQEVTGLLNQHFKRAAEQQQIKEANDLAAAPDPALDTWANAYRKSINDTESQLQDYQSRLFEKLRPQLLTSLQSQGLLNTGALNDAFAGANRDLTESNLGFISQARQQAEQDINNARYSRSSLPVALRTSAITGRIPSLTASGQTALQNSFQNAANLNYLDRQYELNKRLQDSQPSGGSLLSQYGGQILGGALAGFTGGLGRGIGGGLGSRFARPAMAMGPYEASAGYIA